jgi:hypothetical protein
LVAAPPFLIIQAVLSHMLVNPVPRRRLRRASGASASTDASVIQAQAQLCRLPGLTSNSRINQALATALLFASCFVEPKSG